MKIITMEQINSDLQAAANDVSEGYLSYWTGLTEGKRGTDLFLRAPE
jgi:hypothetical protein